MTTQPLSKNSVVPEAAQKPFPGFAQALGLLGLSFLSTICTRILFSPLDGLELSPKLGWMPLAQQLCAAALLLWLLVATKKASWEGIFPHRPVPASVWPLTAISVWGLHLLIHGLGDWVELVFPMPRVLLELLEKEFLRMGWASIVVGAPLAEEPLFRGLILGGFIRRYGSTNAIVYSALLFVIFHLNPWQAAAGLVTGLFLGWLTIRTGSLWPAVCAHLLNNLYAITLGDTSLYSFLMAHPVWLWGSGLLVAGMGLKLLHEATRPSERATSSTHQP